MTRTTKDRSPDKTIYPFDKDLYQKTVIAAMQGLLANPNFNLCQVIIQTDGSMNYTHYAGVLAELADVLGSAVFSKINGRTL